MQVTTATSPAPGPARIAGSSRTAAPTSATPVSFVYPPPRDGSAITPQPELERAVQRNIDSWNAHLRERFGRNGWDGAGGAVKVSINPKLPGAEWSYGVMYTGPAGRSPDAVSHELTHGLLYSMAPKADFIARNNAVSESWADVLTALRHPGDWRITVPGPDGRPEVLRDLRTPEHRTVQEASSTIEPHRASGPISLAAVRLAEKIGHERTADIWYGAIPHFNKLMYASTPTMEQLQGDQHELDRWMESQGGGFTAAARATLAASRQLHPETVAAVRDAWKSVGQLVGQPAVA